MSLFLVLIQRDRQLRQRPVTKVRTLSKAAGWPNAKTFAMFYKKTISENFGQATLRA